MLEHGSAPFSPHHLTAIATVFQIPVASLFRPLKVDDCPYPFLYIPPDNLPRHDTKDWLYCYDILWENISHLLDATAYTRPQFAQFCGLTRTYFSRRSHITLETMVKIASAVDLPVSAFWTPSLDVSRFIGWRAPDTSNQGQPAT